MGRDPVCDVDRKITRPLHLVEDAGRGDQESEIGRDRLLECEDLERPLLERSVERVDWLIAGAYGFDEIQPVIDGDLTGAAGVLHDE